MRILRGPWSSALLVAGLCMISLSAEAICGRKSCVVGSMPAYGGGGGGGGYDPFAGMGGMVDMMFGVMNAIEAQQKQMTMAQARAEYNQGVAFYNNGDYVAAVAALQRALRLNPNDATVRAALQQAEQTLADLRRQEGLRQEADRKARQERIAGIIGGLSSGFDGAASSAPSAVSGVDFAPAGTSFFGTGGGSASAPTSSSGASTGETPAPRTRPAAGNSPAYSAAQPPAQSSQGLDFVGTKDPLFDKGHQGSAPVVVGDGVAARKPPTAGSAQAPGKLEFSTSTAPAKPAAADRIASLQPDPINYEGAKGFRGWAVRTFAPVTGAAEQAASDPGIPTPRPPVVLPKDFLPPEMAPKQPMAATADMELRQRRAREIANLAFDRMGTAQYDSAVRFLEVAQEQAPNDERIARALAEAKDVRSKMPTERELRELQAIEAERFRDLVITVPASDGTQQQITLSKPRPGDDPLSPSQWFVSRGYAAKGYESLHNGDYAAATEFFSGAALGDPTVRDWQLRIHQARIGHILSGSQ